MLHAYRTLGCLVVLLVALGLHPARSSGGDALLMDAEELSGLSTSSRAWHELVEFSDQPVRDPDLSNQADPTNVIILAKALVAARVGDAAKKAEVIAAIDHITTEDTEAGGRTLALGRELAAYVIAADLVGLDAARRNAFEQFLRRVRERRLDGRTLISTHEDRPNNWGTHAGASRIAVARYLGDDEDLDDAAQVLRGFLGDRSAYSQFDYGDLWWQSDPSAPVGVNPAGAQIAGHSVDGVIPDDQRRAGPFAWPPPTTNYAWEALQGLLLQAILLERAGYDVWEWSDRALLRAARWLIVDAAFPPTGDDQWQLEVFRHFYPNPGFTLPQVPVRDSIRRPGKGFGFTAFLYPS